MAATVQQVRYKAYGLDLDLTLLDGLPRTEDVQARLLEAMKKSTGLLRTAIARSLAASGVRSRTGRLVGGLQESVSQAGGVTIGRAFVGKDQRHVARFLEYGTAPHEILPKGATKSERAAFYRSRRNRNRQGQRLARALAFAGQNGRQFARRVQHPGVRARRFLQAAGVSATPSVVAAFQAAFRDLGDATGGVGAVAQRPVYGQRL